MDGSATPTIETSSASRNIAAHSTSRVPQSLGVQRTAEEGSAGVVSGEVMPKTLHARASNARAFNSDAMILLLCYGAAHGGEEARAGARGTVAGPAGAAPAHPGGNGPRPSSTPPVRQ